MPDEIINDSIDKQPEKAYSPILLTVGGTSIIFNNEQLKNAHSPMVVTDEGIVIDSSNEHP